MIVLRLWWFGPACSAFSSEEAEFGFCGDGVDDASGFKPASTISDRKPSPMSGVIIPGTTRNHVTQSDTLIYTVLSQFGPVGQGTLANCWPAFRVGYTVVGCRAGFDRAMVA